MFVGSRKKCEWRNADDDLRFQVERIGVTRRHLVSANAALAADSCAAKGRGKRNTRSGHLVFRNRTSFAAAIGPELPHLAQRNRIRKSTEAIAELLTGGAHCSGDNEIFGFAETTSRRNSTRNKTNRPSLASVKKVFSRHGFRKRSKEGRDDPHDRRVPDMAPG